MNPEHVHNRENVFLHRENRRWRELSLYALTSRANLAHLGKQEGCFTNGHVSFHWLCQQRWDQTCFSFHCQFHLFLLSDTWRKKVCLCALSRQTVTLQRRACAFSTVGVYNTNLKGFRWSFSSPLRLCWAEGGQSREKSDRIQSQAGSDTTCFLISFSLVVIDLWR